MQTEQTEIDRTPAQMPPGSNEAHLDASSLDLRQQHQPLSVQPSLAPLNEPLIARRYINIR
jgi:hypothetical protein